MSTSSELESKIVQGLEKTASKIKKENQRLQKENNRLQKELGIFKEEGFVEELSLPLIKIGAGYKSRPECEVHGAMLRYKNDIWRCEACKTAVDLSENLKWIREEFDGVVVIK